jgi:GntR family transcriptional regulator
VAISWKIKTEWLDSFTRSDIVIYITIVIEGLMRFRLEPNSGVPLGQQIIHQIRLAVAARRLVPGEKLPSARDLAAELGVNFHTVRKAYADLEAEGVLRSDRGIGTFVPEEAPRLDPAALRRVVREHVERLAADLAGLGLPAEEVEALLVSELRAVFRANGGGGAPSAGGHFFSPKGP